MATPGGPPPAVPEGWQVSWSDQYNQWFYVSPATGVPQWEHPFGPAYVSQPAAAPQPGYYPPAQQQYVQQGFAPSPIAAQPAAPATTGIMGKLSNLDSKAQTALAVGGGLAAGALLEHEIDEFSGTAHSNRHSGHHHVFGTMTNLIGAAGAAGAGALGSKLFGKMGQATHATPPPPVQPIPPSAPGSGLGMGGLGKLAGALGVGGAANMLYQHHNQAEASAGAPTAVAGSGGMSSFLGGITYSGPRSIIHTAAYADMDVTAKVRARVTPDQVYTIESMKDEFGDPWPEAQRKGFSILYQYGDRPLEVWAGSTDSGKVDIRHEALANVRMSYINKDPGRIISLIWGSQSILSAERVEKLEKDGELDCNGLGDGGFSPWQARSLICYYRDPHGGVGIGHGREGGTLRLPWNPLAKWS